MNPRDLEIIKHALDVLHLRDAQMADAILHGEVRLRCAVAPTVAEFESAMQVADGHKWIISVPAKFGKGYRRSLTNAGQGARLEMEQG